MRESILLVHDQPESLEVLTGILQEEDYILHFAANGEQALKSVKNNAPDLILMKTVMPVLNGFEACKQLKSVNSTKHTPIIFICDSHDENHKIKAFEVGGVDCIKKPFHLKEALARIKTHLKQHTSRKKLIERQKMLIKGLKENELFQIGMINSAHYPIIIVNNKNEIIQINPMFTQHFGYSEDEILKKSINTLIPKRFHKAHDTHTSKYHDAPEWRSMGIGMELRAVSKSGREFPVEISLTPLRKNGEIVLVSIRDVSERVKAEIKIAKELKDSKDRLTFALEAGRLGVWEWDIKKDKDTWDKSMYNLFGVDYKTKRDVRDIWKNLLHPDDLDGAIQKILNSIEKKSRLSTSYRIIDNTGKVRYLTSNATLELDDNNEPLRMIGINMDVTSEIEVKKNLKRSNKELENFAYVASHDLQEPLRVITSYIQLIQEKYNDGLSERGLQLMDRIIGASDRMKQLINGLLEYSRVDKTKTPFELANLNDLIDDVIKDNEVLIKERKATLVVDELEDIFCDKVQIRQVFTNLLNNGIKYHKKGQIPEIRITLENINDKGIEISFVDNGIGINSEFHNRVFDIFQRLHTREEYEGTGLGLAIVKKIIERHGGEIKIDSDYTEGTKFKIILPKKNTQYEGKN